MNVFIAWFVRHVFGDSPLALRLLPAIVGAALVWMTGQLTREMVGSRFAQALSAFAIIPVPIYFNHAPLAYHECLRAAPLDGLRLVRGACD